MVIQIHRQGSRRRPWIAAEPAGRSLSSILGHHGFELKSGTSHEEAKAVASFLNRSILSDPIPGTCRAHINCGRFLGFSEPTPNISYFTLTDSYIGLSNLTIAS